jgi:DNA invertase Pin-like site-specific DNA recombinase
MADARRGAFYVVVVWRFDRFARRIKQLVLALEEFHAMGIDLISHQEALDTSTPMGRAMFTIIAAMAEQERDVIGERAAAGLEYAPQHGTKSGKPIGRPTAVFRHD